MVINGHRQLICYGYILSPASERPAKMMYEDSLSETLSASELSRVHVPGMDQDYDDTAEFYRYYSPPSYNTQVSADCVFDVPDAEETLKLFRKPFKIVNPGNHITKRTPEYSSISFMHCRHLQGLGKQYMNLRSVMEERARLEFLRDCLFRIKSVTTFVHDLENLVQAEYRTYYAIMHNCLMDNPSSKIYCLNALCEDLRTHVGHWNNIKQCLHNNRWLQPILGRLYLDLEYVRRVLSQLYSDAIYWMEKLIVIGLQVFAHGSMATLTQEIVWNIARGLEDFNNVANGLFKSRYMSISYFILEHLQSEMTNLTCKSDPRVTNHPGHVSFSVKAIPFSKILNIIAVERAKYAAIETHRFFTANEDFVRILYSGKLPNYVWNDEVQYPGHISHHLDTSDYHTASGSMTSISGAILKVGSVRAPDLTPYEPPLNEFARHENEFAENFLLIVCNSTNLLRKGESSSKSKHKSGKSPRSPSSKPPKGQDTPVLSRADSKRKTVSWGDSADTSIRSQLTNRYMDVLWRFFGSALEQCFYEPLWGCRSNQMVGELGSVVLSGATMVTVVRNMMEHVCLKDMFPTNAVPPILGVARKLHAQTALQSWDILMCEALGCQMSDKCYPCLLASGDHSTKTGMLLRDTYQPLFSLLQENLKDLPESAKDGSLLLPRQDLDLSQVTGIICRLLANGQVAHSWCVHKSHGFLSSWAVGSFLLVTQTDLKILADEMKKALHNAQLFSSKNVSKTKLCEQQMGIYLSEVTRLMSEVNNQLQSLSGAAIKVFSDNCSKLSMDYFSSEMPQGKVWRKKADLPAEHSLYIEHALETILEPVIDGVSKLKKAAQLGVVSQAINAFCEAWKNNILKHKIKFSYVGAYQLGVDIGYMRAWLGEYVTDPEVRQAVLDLQVFKYLSGAVMILKKQPFRRGGSKFREPCSMEDLSCNGHADLENIKVERNISRSVDTDLPPPMDESDIEYVNNINEWLSLRVQGGSRAWKLSCLNAPQTND
ncbi:uncharacterized protein LOC128181378 isoform X4 [Crassostrea angulata]|uniref:uncharacterized protein LOC128181378 isoform X4 n=1 Tax=Magallana angulata TaxID=2784310 RepID=UPI0022B0D46D|nr:uncharacterized protein LOC128181378 isoform X4 [Crassostrea angulata]